MEMIRLDGVAVRHRAVVRDRLSASLQVRGKVVGVAARWPQKDQER